MWVGGRSGQRNTQEEREILRRSGKCSGGAGEPPQASTGVDKKKYSGEWAPSTLSSPSLKRNSDHSLQLMSLGTALDRRHRPMHCQRRSGSFRYQESRGCRESHQTGAGLGLSLLNPGLLKQGHSASSIQAGQAPDRQTNRFTIDDNQENCSKTHSMNQQYTIDNPSEDHNKFYRCCSATYLTSKLKHT